GEGFLTGARGLTTTQAALGVTAGSVFAPGDALRFSASQPLQAVAGAFLVTAPSAFDAQSGAFVLTERAAPLTDGPRAVDFEASYTFASFGAGTLSVSAARQLNAGPSGEDATLALVQGSFGF
ncbi:MAG: hypothetical protein AAGC56_13780, partial [Pseudomonadota bacterium]